MYTTTMMPPTNPNIAIFLKRCMLHGVVLTSATSTTYKLLVLYISLTLSVKTLAVSFAILHAS